MQKPTLRLQKENALQKLTSEFPKTNQRIIYNLISTAYQEVDEFVNKKIPDWMIYGRGKRLIPDLKNSAVEYQLMRACDSKIIKFGYEIEKNKNISADYLKLVSSDNSSIITVNQTRNGNKSSRDAIYRNDLKDIFQTRFELFEENVGFTDMDDIQYYFEINHGYQSTIPGFSVIGIPDEKRNWYARLRIDDNFNVLSAGEEKDISTVMHDLKGFDGNDFGQFIQSKDE